MTFNNTIEDIKKRTGLKEPFIRKCIINLDYIFKPYMTRGTSNSFLFDENSMFLWDKIGQLKNQDLTIEKIKEQLDTILSSKISNTNTKSYSVNQNNEYFEQLIKEVKTMYKEILLAKDETIKSKDMMIEHLNHNILLLTGGKEPEQALEDYKKKDIDIALLKKDLSHIEIKINDKDLEISKFNSQIEKMKQEQEDIKAKQKSLLMQLESLEGKLFTGSKRKEILKELQSIS